MTTVISNNLKRTSERINTNWDVINPITKEVLQKKESEYIEPTIQPTVTEAPKQNSKIDEMINNLVEKKINEMVAKKVEEALSKL